MPTRRVQQDWPPDREFRILAIDGGGIKGIFPAAILSGLENQYLGGKSITSYFDLITGTSTGGIIALGLAAGLQAKTILELYTKRGNEIFPPGYAPLHFLRKWLRVLKYSYDREALKRILVETFQEKKFGSAETRLCIPSFDGTHGEVAVFKTPHHADFKKDAYMSMVDVACATAAAPTFFRPYKSGGYTFVDGGVWANNPIMIGLVDALSCFNVQPQRVSILSISCGDAPYIIENKHIEWGGLFQWRKIMNASMHLQSLNARGQAGLLIGADKITRLSPRPPQKKIEMDDWLAAKEYLPTEAEFCLHEVGDSIAKQFLQSPVEPYEPLIAV